MTPLHHPQKRAGHLAIVAILLMMTLPASAQVVGSFNPGSKTTEGAAPATAITDGKAPPVDEKAEQAWRDQQLQVLRQGDAWMEKRNPEAAIREGYEPVIAAYEAKYPQDDKVQYFSVRTMPETLLYLTSAAADHDRTGVGRRAVALDELWSYAYYSKGYALFELNRFDEAGQALDKALALSPHNAKYLVERSQVHRARGEWEQMLALNQSALAFIDIATPDDLKKSERAVALRSQGFALIELNRLDEAQDSFKQSLKFDSKSEIARGELEYIKKLRKQKQ